MTKRPDTLPSGATCYKTVGPFDADALPQGLQREHRLKPGAWGLLTLLEGEIAFVWDDDEGGEVLLQAPTTIVIPPEVPHHLRQGATFRLSIGFHRTDRSLVEGSLPSAPASAHPVAKLGSRR